METRMRRRALPVPPEGEGGFSQSWYPVCLSSEVAAGQVIGLDFLDGRIVVMRGADGVAQALSAYCPHMGADLACGAVDGNEIQCAFHAWSFARDGACTKTLVGDPVPPRAKLFRFPTAERWGIVWAFNGETALYDVPGFDRPDDELIFASERHWLLPCDPPCLVCNSVDMQHIVAVHGFDIDRPTHFDSIEWTPYRVRSKVDAHVRDSGVKLDWETVVFGTNAVRTIGMFGDRWLGTMVTFGIPAPGSAQTYCITVTEKGGEEAQQFLDGAAKFTRGEVEKDSVIMRRIRFVQGTLTKSDRAVAEMLKHFRAYPRAHQSADYIA